FFTSDEADWKVPDPADYEIRNNYFYKDDKYIYGNPRSDGRYYDNRHFLELKRGRRYLIDGNIFDGNFGTLQQGLAVNFSNNGGYAPTDNVPEGISDITVTNNIFTRNPMAIGVNGHLFGRWGLATEPVQRVNLTNNLIVDNVGRYANPGWGASRDGAPAAGFQLGNGAEDITVKHNTLYGSTWAILVLDQTAPDLRPSANLVFQDNVSVFGIGFSGQGSAGLTALEAAWKRIPNRGWAVDHNVLIGPFDQIGLNKISDNPAGNFYVDSETQVGFVDSANRQLALSSSSPYKGRASDGADPGVDWAKLVAATKDTKTGKSTAPFNPPERKLAPPPPQGLRVD
ncbi:MAG TPA: hypothetical protein VLS90_12850, partial [Thermodesulfobacteriota bacterium]|nr:hypothetical protein [Thermodesulfobacteriota bacterium]